jgi:hypothetical protein
LIADIELIKAACCAMMNRILTKPKAAFMQVKVFSQIGCLLFALPVTADLFLEI